MPDMFMIGYHSPCCVFLHILSDDPENTLFQKKMACDQLPGVRKKKKKTHFKEVLDFIGVLSFSI